MPTDEEKVARASRLSESLVGRTIVVWWGGSEPYSATVIAENDRNIVVQSVTDSKYHKAGEFEIIDRHQRENCFFDSLEDGREHTEHRKQDWEAGKKEYEDHISGAVQG